MPDLVLGDSLELLVDNRGKNPPFEKSGIPVLSAKAIKNGVIAFKEARYISWDTYARWMPSPLRKNDVILTSEAPLGECALVTSDEPLAIAQRLYALRGKSGVLDSRYLYYALQSETVQTDLRNRSSGTTVSGIRQPELLKVRIPDPGYRQQTAISSVLGALDDKITTNVRIAAKLDELLRLQYQQACRRAPESIAIGKLGRLIRNGVAASSLAGDEHYIGLEHMPRRNMWLSTFGNAAELASGKSAFQAGDVLFGKLRPYFHKVGLALTSGVCSTDVFVVRPMDPNNLGWLLLALSSDEVVGHASAVGDGTRMPRAKWKDLEAYEVPWPGDQQAARLNEIVRSLADRVQVAVQETQSLASLRDTLLPELVSGRLRVRDAEKIVEDHV